MKIKLPKMKPEHVILSIAIMALILVLTYIFQMVAPITTILIITAIIMKLRRKEDQEEEEIIYLFESLNNGEYGFMQQHDISHSFRFNYLLYLNNKLKQTL